MSLQTKHTQLDSELILWESSESPIKINALTIALTKEVHKVKDCRLTFQVTPEQYQLIDKQALFNLKPEIRTPLSGLPFQPSSNIQIEASLQPDLLPQLTKNAKTSKKATTYLQSLSQEESLHPLLSTNSWYALEVKQQLQTGETGFRTLWNYLKPSDIKDGDIDIKNLSQAILNFSKDCIYSSNLEDSENFISQAIEQINHSLENLDDEFSQISETKVSEIAKHINNNNSDNLEDLISQLVEQINPPTENAELDISKKIREEIASGTAKKMNPLFAEIKDNISQINKKNLQKYSIYQTIINFFNREDWEFQESSDKQGLRLGFKGKNGEWICFAIVREEQQQLLFYSVCMIKAPKNKLANVAEFITIANFGMAIGNFELDLTDGEIRYKTSIDVNGDRLNFDLISNLVYTNVMMMDKYLPGIIWVIRGDMEAEEAILRVEG